MLLHPLFQAPTTPRETLGEKPGGSRAARVVGAALEPPGFSPSVSQGELWELEKGGGPT
jgi:hypothetical protein